MKLDFEYGHGFMRAELPDTTDVFIPGETVPDPPCLPQDWDSLYQATLHSIRHPVYPVLLRCPSLVKTAPPCQQANARRLPDMTFVPFFLSTQATPLLRALATRRALRGFCFRGLHTLCHPVNPILLRCPTNRL